MGADPAPNAVTSTVTDYAPDPNGWAMVAGLQRKIAGTLNGARKVMPASATWHGWTEGVQKFHGHAGLGAGRVFAPRSSTMQDQNTGQSLVSAIFLDRAGRGVS